MKTNLPNQKSRLIVSDSTDIKDSGKQKIVDILPLKEEAGNIIKPKADLSVKNSQSGLVDKISKNDKM